MPWQERSPVDLRLQFMTEYLTDVFSMTELAAQYGISRKTAYKWVARYQTEGPAGLGDRSRRPRAHPDTTPRALVEALLAAATLPSPLGREEAVGDRETGAARSGLAESFDRV